MPPPSSADEALPAPTGPRRPPVPEISRPTIARQLIPYRGDFYCIAAFETPIGETRDLHPLAGSLDIPYGPVWVPYHVSRTTILSPAEN